VIVARKPGSPPTEKVPAVDHEVIRELAKLLDETGLTEIEFERDGVSIRVARNLNAPQRRRLPRQFQPRWPLIRYNIRV
jgi:hypothetical protein